MDKFIQESPSHILAPKKQLSLFAIGGGVCDVYQQAEEKYKITRKLLQVAYKFMIPISILTKSEMVARDLKLIQKISTQSYANVSFSITQFDDEVRKVFEPNSSSTEKRFDTLELIRKNDIPGGIMLMPILPGIGDTEENLRSIVKKGKDIGANFILPAGLTLKPGRNKDEMLTTIQNYYPEFSPHYEHLYSNNNKYGIPIRNSKFSRNGAKIVHEFCRRYGIPDRIPRYLSPWGIKVNHIISTILFNLAYYFQYVSEQKWQKTANFSKTAQVIEQSSQSVASLTRKELRVLISDETVLEIVEEILHKGKSTVLSQYQDPGDIFEGNPSVDEFLT